MSSVKELTDFINSLGPERDISRLTFYNFLLHRANEGRNVDTELINEFLCFSQNYDHWRKNMSTLLSGVKDSLERFERAHPVQLNINDDLDPQFIYVKKMSELSLFISKYLNSSNSENIKVAPLANNSMAALEFTESGLEVRVYSNALIFRNGELQPTNPISHLHYSNNLTLLPHVQHQLQLSPTSYCNFVLNSEGSHGSGWIYRGYSIQKYAQLSFQRMHEAPDLFQALKRLEYLYINTQTDPDYLHLVQLIEQSCASIQSDDAGCESLAKNAIEKTKFALENLYPDDRYLTLLLSQLELSIIRRYQNPAHALEI